MCQSLSCWVPVSSLGSLLLMSLLELCRVFQKRKLKAGICSESLTVLCPVWTTVAFGPFVVSFHSIPFTYCSAASCLTATSCVYCQSFKFTSKLIFYSLYASLRGAEGNMPRHFIRILLVLFCLENCPNSPFHRFSKVQNNSWDLAPYWHDSIT